MRTAVIAVIAAAVVIAASIGAVALIHHENDGSEEVYGIVVAMDEEAALLIQSMTTDHIESIGSSDYHIGELCGKSVVVVRCYDGKVNSAMCTQTLIDRFGATAIINSGVGGTLSDRVGIGDIVISTETVQHDYDESEIGYDPGVVPNIGMVAIPADPVLRDTAVQAISKVAVGIEVFQGRICTGDQFISGAEEMHQITDRFGGICCEMEGGAVAQVCYLNKVPFVVIRAISDDVNGGGPADYEKFMKEMSDLCAKMTMEMLKELKRAPSGTQVPVRLNQTFMNEIRIRTNHTSRRG